MKDLLPIGSVVTLKEGTKKLMIMGRLQQNVKTKKLYVNIPWWRSHPIHENRATESICTEPCNPLLRATKSMKRATSTY